MSSANSTKCMRRMVNNHIQVYARIKKEVDGHKARYDVITDSDNYDIMNIYESGNTFSRKRRSFRFNKVFDDFATQDDIFNMIAQPIIHDVFEGLNATIFAYGATGSGKTYTLTGSQSKYHERGLIPRTIEYMFKLVSNRMSNFMFFISYLEIYNENAYDLLNPKQGFTCLEDLPRVVVLEDEKGEAHFKNLCLKEVNTEKEAMRLLYSGDSNRTIAETPLNDYSSRSHCVFTVHVISKCHMSGSIKRSKLNLVDLAGSERLHRMNLQGMTLNEARHINLSLHYLERVIQALSDKSRHHVPYRNSMMTFILRDSLGGNCLTAMLANLSMLHLNIEETISTCKFAQRVCLIKLNANINYMATPENEIDYLRNELRRLKRQMKKRQSISSHFPSEKLTRAEESECKIAVNQYLLGKEDLKLDDPRKVKIYIDCMREKLVTNSNNDNYVRSVEEVKRKYQQLIDEKDQEISVWMNVFDTKAMFKPLSAESLLNDNSIDDIDRNEFKRYLNSSNIKSYYDTCTKQIKAKYHEAVKISQIIATKQRQISHIKDTISKTETHDIDMKMRLNLDQSFYREQLRKIHNIKGDIEDLKVNMDKIKLRILEEYKTWAYLKHERKLIVASVSPSRSLPLIGANTQGMNTIESNANNYIIASPWTSITPLSTLNSMHLSKTKNVGTAGKNNSIDDVQKKQTSIVQTHSLQTLHPTPTKRPHVVNLELVPQAQCDIQPSSKKNALFELSKMQTQCTQCSSESSESLESSGSLDSEAEFRNKEIGKLPNSILKYVNANDSYDLLLYLKSIPLTGDEEVDDEIVKFYRLKFKRRERT